MAWRWPLPASVEDALETVRLTEDLPQAQAAMQTVDAHFRRYRWWRGVFFAALTFNAAVLALNAATFPPDPAMAWLPEHASVQALLKWGLLVLPLYWVLSAVLGFLTSHDRYKAANVRMAELEVATIDTRMPPALAEAVVTLATTKDYADGEAAARIVAAYVRRTGLSELLSGLVLLLLYLAALLLAFLLVSTQGANLLAIGGACLLALGVSLGLRAIEMRGPRARARAALNRWHQIAGTLAVAGTLP